MKPKKGHKMTYYDEPIEQEQREDLIDWLQKNCPEMVANEFIDWLTDEQAVEISRSYDQFYEERFPNYKILELQKPARDEYQEWVDESL